MEEVYFIELWNVDDDGIKSGIYISEHEFKEYPSQEEILEILEKYNCKFAKVEKYYKKAI